MAGEPDPELGCGFINGFHRDDLAEAIVKLKPSQRGEWLHSSAPAATQQRVKIQVWTEGGDWAILTGRVETVTENAVVAVVDRTTENEAIAEGPYRVVLTHDPKMQNSWVLSHADLVTK